jgi:AcrR family transcriptional regulator
VLPEQESDKAARILAVARDLVLRHGVKGVTVATIAKKAHIGHGTVYLYWANKEELLLGLFARDFLAMLDSFAEALTADPDNAKPERLCPMAVRAPLEHPFVRALQDRDDDLLGALSEHPAGRELLGTLGPRALMQVALPAWREHGMARTDWEFERQAYALNAMMAGFLATISAPETAVDYAGEVMAATVTALLGPSTATAEDVRAVAAEGLRQIDVGRQAALASILPR